MLWHDPLGEHTPIELPGNYVLQFRGHCEGPDIWMNKLGLSDEGGIAGALELMS